MVTEITNRTVQVASRQCNAQFTSTSRDQTLFITVLNLRHTLLVSTIFGITLFVYIVVEFKNVLCIVSLHILSQRSLSKNSLRFVNGRKKYSHCSSSLQRKVYGFYFLLPRTITWRRYIVFSRPFRHDPVFVIDSNLRGFEWLGKDFGDKGRGSKGFMGPQRGCGDNIIL